MLGRRQEWTVMLEVQSQLNLTAWNPRRHFQRKNSRRWRWNQEAGREEVGDQAQTIVNSGSGPDYQICIPLGWAPWVRVAYSGQTQKKIILKRVKFQFLWPSSKDPCGFQCQLLYAFIVLVSAHPKLRSFVRLCAWFMVSLGPKPPLAHYPAFIVCLATTSLKK